MLLQDILTSISQRAGDRWSVVFARERKGTGSASQRDLSDLIHFSRYNSILDASYLRFPFRVSQPKKKARLSLHLSRTITDANTVLVDFI